MSYKHKVALITGGASGMGAATAKFLAAKGMQVAILDRQLSLAEQVAQSIGGLAVQADVGNSDSVQTALTTVLKQFKEIHVCINCAGIAPSARIVGREGPMPLQDFEQVIQINLVGTFNIMRCVAHYMIKQKPLSDDGERGVIINTASIAAFEGQVGQAAYSASKGGIVAMTLPAAREFSQFGIRVMTIAPGVIETPLMEKMSQDVRANLATNIPFPKRLGKGEEYAQLVGHIIENSYLNGSVIRLDGALRMGR